MTQEFYKEKLMSEGIEVVIPNDDDIERINDVIYHELCLGIISDQSKQEYLRIINQMAKKGADGILLACTEIGMLIKQEDTSLPVFDTTQIHARRAALFAIND